MTIHKRNRQNPQIRDFILRNVEEHPDKITALAIKEFGLSRAAIIKYIQRLIKDGVLTAEGNTKSRHYKLKKIVDITFSIKLLEGMPEDIVWIYRILPFLKNESKNVIDICQYGFTEMLNNAIDHSISSDALISLEKTHNEIKIYIVDHGIGIFKKIQTDFNLPDARAALLELSKGQLTSAPSRHAGEGIFFTSRMFDRFTIVSGNLVYSKKRNDDHGWLVEDSDQEKYTQGTIVSMAISTDAD